MLEEIYDDVKGWKLDSFGDWNVDDALKELTKIIKELQEVKECFEYLSEKQREVNLRKDVEERMKQILSAEVVR